MLVYVACFLSCVIVSAIPTGRIRVVYPSIENLRNGEKSVTFHALGQDINLKLQPAAKFLAKYHNTADGAGNKIQDPEFDVENFKRRLHTDKLISGSALIEKDEPLRIYGVVNSKPRIKPQDVIQNSKRALLVFEGDKDKDANFKDKDVLAGIMKMANKKNKHSYNDDNDEEQYHRDVDDHDHSHKHRHHHHHHHHHNDHNKHDHHHHHHGDHNDHHHDHGDNDDDHDGDHDDDDNDDHDD